MGKQAQYEKDPFDWSLDAPFRLVRLCRPLHLAQQFAQVDLPQDPRRDESQSVTDVEQRGGPAGRAKDFLFSQEEEIPFVGGHG